MTKQKTIQIIQLFSQPALGLVTNGQEAKVRKLRCYLLRSSRFDFVRALSSCDIGLITREREREYLEQWHTLAFKCAGIHQLKMSKHKVERAPEFLHVSLLRNSR